MELRQVAEGPETEQAAWRARLSATCARVDGFEVRLTHPKKYLWPEQGFSKHDLVAYYLDVAPYLLPYVVDRPLTMELFPQGVGGPAIFVKQRPRGSPAWLQEACLPATAGHEVCYVLAPAGAHGAATLAWLANRASIPVHAWLSRRQTPRQPDWLAFDLDPGEGATFAQVVRVALWLGERLAELGLRSWPKVSGAQGVHVLAPLAPEHGFAETRAFAEALALEATRALPHDATLAWPLPERRGRVFIDVRRNAYGATLVAPYAVRARPGAPVSVPVTWEELADPRLTPTRWNIVSTPRRLREVGDPLAEARSVSQRLPSAHRRRVAS
jgi:bifunctional non-homologous end joining protein LigD